jgi:hypothetical protein
MAALTKSSPKCLTHSATIYQTQSLELLHLKAAEGDWIAVASKTDMSLAIVEALGRMLDLTAIKGIDIDVEDLGAVECYFDLLTADFDLFKVPFADGAQVTMFRSDTVIERAVILIR